MLSISIGEIQKNTSIFANLTGPTQIIDKRKKQAIATVYPIKKRSIIKKISGKYKDKVKKSDMSFEKIKELSMTKAMSEKHGLSS